jgi:tetratricopeptide (TPR) repeat protein
MHCGKCGAELLDTANFCTKCGAPSRVSPIPEGAGSAGDDRVRQTMEKKGEEWLELALKTGDPEKKLEYCAKHLDVNSQDSDVWEYKAKILDNLRKESEAVDCYKEAAMGGELKYNMGQVHLGQEDSKAVSCFSDVLEENPSHVNAWVGKGEALNNLKRYQESIACVEKVLALNPRKLALVNAWIVKGMALEGLGRLDEAVECYDRSLEIDVSNHRALLSKAIALSDSERYEEAIVCSDQLLQKYPNPDRMNAMLGFKKNAETRLQEKRRVESKKQERPEESKDGPSKKGFIKKLFG